jgi:glycerol-3-phosphate dehydrogenase
VALDIGIVGAGINGMCTAWLLAQDGHKVTVYERNTPMSATSSASSKLLHGGCVTLKIWSSGSSKKPCKSATPGFNVPHT